MAPTIAAAAGSSGGCARAARDCALRHLPLALFLQCPEVCYCPGQPCDHLLVVMGVCVKFVPLLRQEQSQLLRILACSNGFQAALDGLAQVR
jgi:hypothetical protein